MPPDAVSVQQQHPVLAQASDPIASPTSKLHVPPWAQTAWPESLKNGHVRAPESLPRPQGDAQPQPSRGHKRSASGEIKSPVQYETQRQFSSIRPTSHLRTESLDSTGNRIAELSAQLRARLSYAAAKVEESRQLRQPGDGASLQATISAPGQSMQGSQRLYNGSPEDGSTSAPELSLSHISFNKYGSISQSRTGPAQSSSTLETPRLAPPVDIITSDRTKTVRRRPNPNDFGVSLSHNSTSGHRRHYSEQEGKLALSAGSRKAEMPGTLLFTPSRSKTNDRALTPLISSNQSPVKRRTPSQNALMEKDAIETLLFMSSPENSGYHSNSQARKSSVSVSIEAQMAASVHESSQGSNKSQSNQMGAFDSFDHERIRTALPGSMHGYTSIGLEAQAGDDIDRLLDQMEVDKGNDAEQRLMSYGFDISASDK